MAFRFYDTNGDNVVLSNNQQTAEYRGDTSAMSNVGGVVMSYDAMDDNKLYEVTLADEKGWSLRVGVVTSSPASLQPLPVLRRNVESSVVVYPSDCFDHCKWRTNKIGKALMKLSAGSRVGVSVDSNRRLHLHVNGEDQGVVPCEPRADPYWAMFQLWVDCKKITALPVSPAVYAY